jgi:hypothetical protein
MLKSALAKAATVKVAVVLAAVGGGGVALAAGSGHLPGVGTSNDHAAGRPTTSVTPNEHASAAAGMHRSSDTATHGSPDTATHRSPSDAAHGSAARDASPSPNLRGLCTAFQAGVGDNPGKALDNPAFTVLINTAGSKDKVANYCTTLLAAPAGASSMHAPPTSHARPTARPTDVPSTHPTGPEQTASHHQPTAPPTHGH